MMERITGDNVEVNAIFTTALFQGYGDEAKEEKKEERGTAERKQKEMDRGRKEDKKSRKDFKLKELEKWKR